MSDQIARCAHGVPATDPCEACVKRCASIPGADDPLPGEGYGGIGVACPHVGDRKCIVCDPEMMAAASKILAAPDLIYPTAEQMAETARRDGTAWWHSLPVGVQEEREHLAAKRLHLMRHDPADQVIAAIREILLSGRKPG